MQNTQVKKTFPGSGRFDPINSTYKHKIQLLNGTDLIGYSKGLLQNEMPDKIVLLERVILRLYNNGYLNKNKTSSILFYKNEVMTASNLELLLVLKPDTYEYGANREIISDIRLSTFLSRFYDQIKRGNMVTKSLSHKSGNIREEALFDISKKRFQNEKELGDYMQLRIKEGHAFDLCVNFFINYRSKWL